MKFISKNTNHNVLLLINKYVTVNECKGYLFDYFNFKNKYRMCNLFYKQHIHQISFNDKITLDTFLNEYPNKQNILNNTKKTFMNYINNKLIECLVPFVVKFEFV